VRIAGPPDDLRDSRGSWLSEKGTAATDDGLVFETGKEVVPVVWPAGFHGVVDPVRLLDSTGATFASDGDTVVVAGGYLNRGQTRTSGGSAANRMTGAWAVIRRGR
jgi:hypothetical protein